MGREHELLEAVAVVLDRDPRLLTVVGPGGAGKTRFAIELARLLADEAEGGTVFVPLAPVREPASSSHPLAQAVGASAPECAAIASALRGRRTHVVLDNLEHLLPDAAVLVAQLLTAAPELRLLATSREALRVQGERRFELPPLGADEAVALFLDRAEVDGAASNRPPQCPSSAGVSTVCRSRSSSPPRGPSLLSPEELLERLRGRLDLLRGGRDADPRHATLRATIAWSYDLLEQCRSRRSALASRSSRPGARSRAPSSSAAPTSIHLESLLDKSLLRRRVGPLGEHRFWMLETIREYAHERLAESSESELLHRRHAERMLAIARMAQLEDDGSSLLQRHELALAERDDLRAALDWAAESDAELGIRIAVSLESFWAAHAPAEGARRLGVLLDRADTVPSALQAAALRVLGAASTVAGEVDFGVQRYEECAAMFDALGDERGAANVRVRLALHEGWNGDVARARDLAEECLDTARRHDMPRLEAEALSALGSVARAGGELDEAWELFRRSTEARARARLTTCPVACCAWRASRAPEPQLRTSLRRLRQRLRARRWRSATRCGRRVDWAMARDPHLATEIVRRARAVLGHDARRRRAARTSTGSSRARDVASPELRAPLLLAPGQP